MAAAWGVHVGRSALQKANDAFSAQKIGLKRHFTLPSTFAFFFSYGMVEGLIGIESVSR